MSKQESLNKESTWNDFEEQLKRDREANRDIDSDKHLLNKMSVQAGGNPLFEDEMKNN
ncbi:MAG: hypothetical protein RR565_04755 [Erysipelothrix sp.]